MSSDDMFGQRTNGIERVETVFRFKVWPEGKPGANNQHANCGRALIGTMYVICYTKIFRVFIIRHVDRLKIAMRHALSCPITILVRSMLVSLHKQQI